MFSQASWIYSKAAKIMPNQLEKSTPKEFSLERIREAAKEVAAWPDWMKGSPSNERKAQPHQGTNRTSETKTTGYNATED